MARTKDPARALCAQLGIKIVDCAAPDGPNRTKAGNTIRRMIDEHGTGHATMVLRTITESKDNAGALREQIILAVSDVLLAHPSWPERGLAWLDAFDGVSLKELAGIAYKNRGAVSQRAAIATMIFSRLQPIFGPPIKVPRPRKPRTASQPAAAAA